MMRMRLGLVLAIAAMPLIQSCIPLAVTGAGTAALMAADRRSTGTYIDDEGIELTALGRLHDISGAHVNATSFNRRVLLTGEVPSEEAKITFRSSCGETWMTPGSVLAVVATLMKSPP